MVAFFAVAAAISAGAISMSSMSPIALATGVTSEGSTMMGHVEYVVRDANGNIKQYQQLDNMVVDTGDSCVIYAAFGDADLSGTGCAISANGFTTIAIANGTSNAIVGTDTDLSAAQNNAVAITGTPGIMSTITDATPAGTDGTDASTVVLATERPFTFFAGGTTTNATTVTSAGLFDRPCSTLTAQGICTADDGTMNMFAAQEISVVVGDGDSLDVTWTITVGDAS